MEATEVFKMETLQTVKMEPNEDVEMETSGIVKMETSVKMNPVVKMKPIEEVKMEPTDEVKMERKEEVIQLEKIKMEIIKMEVIDPVKMEAIEAVKEEQGKSPVPHDAIFKEKYTLVDDIIHYVLRNPELHEESDNTETLESGFTYIIGQAVLKMLTWYRNNKLFQKTIKRIVIETKTYRKRVRRIQKYILFRKVLRYVPILETGLSIHYFAFLAVTCELCAQFTALNLDYYVMLVTDAAKASFFVYWDNSTRGDQLEFFAKKFLSKYGECDPINFSPAELRALHSLIYLLN